MYISFLPSEPGNVGQVSVELGLDQVDQLLLHQRVEHLDQDPEAADQHDQRDDQHADADPDLLDVAVGKQEAALVLLFPGDQEQGLLSDCAELVEAAPRKKS